MHRNANKTDWVLRIASALICLTIITSYMVLRMSARYVTSTSEISGGADIAKFNVTVTGILDKGGRQYESLKLYMLPGDVQNFSIEIENDSEFEIEYAVDVLPAGASGDLPISIDFINNSDSGTLGKQDTKTCNAKITWPASDNRFTYHREVNYYTVTVRCEQK